MNFTVPIQKDTEREIFDYIDLDSIREYLDRINAKYDDYGTKIRETLSKESDGKMVLKVLDKNKIKELL